MIGDKISTDILLAQNAGIDSLLVMTGETQPNTIEEEIKVISSEYLQ